MSNLTEKKIPLESKLKGAPLDAIDFVRLCLMVDPQERKSAAELLKHPLFKDLEHTDSTAQERISCPVDFMKHNQDYSVTKVKKNIMHLVKIVHKKMEARLQTFNV